MQEFEKPVLPASPQISRRDRIWAVLTANIAAALVYQTWSFAILVHGSHGATTGFLLGQSLKALPFYIVIFVAVSGLPAYAILSLLLRKSFPSIILFIVVGALAGLFVLIIVTSLASIAFGFGLRMTSIISIFLPFALLAGAAGGAAAWCCLALLRRR